MVSAVKLVLAAATLSAIALAAPRTVPEESLVELQTSMFADNVAKLKQQYSELQVTLKDKTYAQVTPAVQETIDKMKTLINDDVLPAIKKAHTADQDMLDLARQGIQTYTDGIQLQQNNLHKTADMIRGWISHHNTLVTQWRDHALDFISTRDIWLHFHANKTQTCCAKRSAAVLDVAYLEPYHACNFKAPDADHCVQKTEDSVRGYVEPYFENGRQHYLELVNNCAYLEAQTVIKQANFRTAEQVCNDKAMETRKKAEEINTETTTFIENWKNLRTGYTTQIEIKTNEYNTQKGRVESDEGDRKNEWVSINIILCMLDHYVTGGGFNTASLNQCKEGTSGAGYTSHLNIVYPAAVAPIDWTLQEFDKLTEYDHDQTCSENVVPANPVCEVLPQKPFPACTNHL